MTVRRYPAAKAMLAVVAATATVLAGSSASAQQVSQGRWAEEGDPVAKELLELERIWATLACAPADSIVSATTNFVNTYIADDFIGTSPSGSLYGKADMIPAAPASGPVETERDCKVVSAKVRYFGPDVAVIYGSESAMVKGADGKETSRTLIWTDTLMRRAGKWQIIAVQDMTAPAK